jgi:drug/metabolite transporter (DMT)-like permease
MTWRRWIGFLLLCVWSSVGWITSEVLPPRMGVVAGQGLHFLLIGAVALGVAFCRGNGMGSPWTSGWVWIAGAGLGLIGVPFLLLEYVGGMVSGTLVVAGFSLVPVVVILAGGTMRLLVPALVGVAGILLVVPVSLPGSVRGYLGLGLVGIAVIVTGLSLSFMHRLLAGRDLVVSLGLISLVNGVLLGLVGVPTGGVELSWTLLGFEVVRGLLLDAPVIILLVWLVRDLEPHRVSARYLVAPLFTVVEGYLAMRPGWDWRMFVGVLLIGSGAAWLLRADSVEERVGLGLDRDGAR